MTVTLETLRADFEAAREAWAENEAVTMLDAGLRRLKMTRDEYKADALRIGQFQWFLSFFAGYDEDVPDSRIQAAIKGKRLANLIDVYEKHGRRAAMLYRLSEGAIDPREVS